MKTIQNPNENKKVKEWIYSKNLDKELLQFAILKVRLDRLRDKKEDYFDILYLIGELAQKCSDIKFVKLVAKYFPKDSESDEEDLLKAVEDYIFNLKLNNDYKVIATLMVENGEEI